ncbi:MAG: zinc metallopeptidase [Acidobacteria bacterium]|nr:zinc metallopeptidase [Acidobacteriota bacterium]MCA1617367.1 zinc metallopeptidase [Acidobacteriota bacterium]
MKWEGERESSNVEDGRGGGGFPIGGRGASLGCGGLIILLLVSWFTGINPLSLLNMVQGNAPVSTGSPSAPVPSGQRAPSADGSRAGATGDQLGRFASVVLASTEDVWKEQFSKMGKTYTPPKLHLFTQATRSECGIASMATGPFYCQLDRKVYLDLNFFQQLSQRYGAPGDFADAYVIAHEVGHHVQNLLGVFDEMGGGRGRGANSNSVRIELQADCFAGVWGFHANQDRKVIDPGDFEEGLRAAGAIGDDRLQRRSEGTVSPESFTHGSSEDRSNWLRRGLEGGDPGRCNTFQRQLQ